MKKYIFLLAVISVFLLAVISVFLLVAYLTSIKTAMVITSIIFLIFIGLIVLLLFCAFGGDDSIYMKQKYGENYQNLIKDGKLGEMRAAPCQPDANYTNHDIVCKEVSVKLPEYIVVSCKGTLPNFNGDYTETAVIKFEVPISNDIMMKIHSFCDKKINKGEDGFVCNIKRPFSDDNTRNDVFWSLKIIDNCTAEIEYGRV